MKNLGLDFFFNNEYFVIDFENTGGSLDKGHKITGVGVCIVQPQKNKFQVSQKFSTLVNPEREISTFIENLIGIKSDEVNNSNYPKIDEVFNTLEGLYGNTRIFAAHAVKVDYTMYDYLYFQKYKTHLKAVALDTLKLAKKILEIKKANIGRVAELFNINSGSHHQPDFDAYVASVILMESLAQLKKNHKLLDDFKECLSEFK
ncbi:MAG: hypothetical protein KKH98_01120 [Spirochaetes bacterium]|nr:hypothetical protein [Spirochaetota bacterium]